ncbi:hypothetical protein SteCoe_17865 [Stentor coeruleus]|uniref:Uncharacterized protein n=1 Tax=Stentor coeruleus TaxID=5963 RepID=A0A1R2BYD6_9CILI|nr:hypothetical protein SteCoe_17865 [Stentor coeruleus]
MLEKRKYEGSKLLKPDFYKDQGVFDPMITFQPRSAPIAQFPPPKPSIPLANMRKDRQISNKAYFQEFTRKQNNFKALPPINALSSFSSSAFPNKNEETSRMCLRSDSKAIRPKKTIFDAMNASSSTVGKIDDDFFRDSTKNFKRPEEIIQKAIGTPKKHILTKDLDDHTQVKTPTFNSSDEKIGVLKDSHIKLEQNYSNKHKGTNSTGGSAQRYSKDIGNLIAGDIKGPKVCKNFPHSDAFMFEIPSSSKKDQEDRINTHRTVDVIKEPLSASKFSAIESSVSTDFPFMSPAKAKEKTFFHSYMGQKYSSPAEILSARKESPLKIRKDHPKIKVRSGFPKDVFTYKQ